MSDGTIEGFVGGECAQSSVRKAGLGALQAGESVLLRVLPDGDVHFPEARGASSSSISVCPAGRLRSSSRPKFPGR